MSDLFSKKMIFSLVFGWVLSAFLIINYFSGDSDFSGYMIGAKSFGNSKVLKIDGDVIGDKLSISEFESIRREYRNSGRTSAEALSEFAKVLVNDKLAYDRVGLKDYKETEFYKRFIGVNGKEGERLILSNLGESFGVGYDNAKDILSLAEMRIDYIDYLRDLIAKSNVKDSLVDSLLRDIKVNEYVFDLSTVEDIFATEDDFQKFYLDNRVYSEDVYDIDKYYVKGISSKEDLDKFGTGDFDSVKSRVMDYENKLTVIKAKTSELGNIDPSVFVKGGIFIDSGEFDSESSIYVYFVNDVTKGKELGESEARDKIKPILSMNRKVDFVNSEVAKAIDNNEGLSDIKYIKLLKKENNYNIIDDFDSSVYEGLIGLNAGDILGYDENGLIKFIEVLSTERVNGIKPEHLVAINEYYDSKMVSSLSSIQNYILFDNLDVNSYNFSEF